jgi:hypothetical protein
MTGSFDINTEYCSLFISYVHRKAVKRQALLALAAATVPAEGAAAGEATESISPAFSAKHCADQFMRKLVGFCMAGLAQHPAMKPPTEKRAASIALQQAKSELLQDTAFVLKPTTQAVVEWLQLDAQITEHPLVRDFLKRRLVELLRKEECPA